MRYLLDTNALYLLNADFGALSASYQRILTDSANEFMLSPASIWEMAIKVRLGKLDLKKLFRKSAAGQFYATTTR